MAFCAGSVLRCNTKDTARLLGDDRFTALEEEVVIVPKVSSEKPVDCMRGKFGPFRAHSATKVPLWAALEMDRLHLCTIELPPWLHEEELKRMRDDEKANPKLLVKVPEHYIEIAFAFLTHSRAFGDRRRKSRTVYLLRELIDLRRSKIVEGLKDFEIRPTEMTFTNISAAELTCFRTRTLHALDCFLDLLQGKKVADKTGIERSEGDEASLPEDDSSTRLL